jgi:hypothetical protein
MSRSMAYRLMNRRLIRAVKLDSRTLIDVRRSLPYLENLPEVSTQHGDGRWPKQAEAGSYKQGGRNGRTRTPDRR